MGLISHVGYALMVFVLYGWLLWMKKCCIDYMPDLIFWSWKGTLISIVTAGLRMVSRVDMIIIHFQLFCAK